MDEPELRSLPAGLLRDALDALGIPAGWLLGDGIRRAAETQANKPCLPEPPLRRPLGAFRNLVVGTLTEHVFLDRHLHPLELEAFTVIDHHARGEYRDYGVHSGGLELPINVKVASTKFRNARNVVGLEPDDAIPISAYKAIGATERVPDLIYADLVDFGLRERVDALMQQLAGPLGIGWMLLGLYGGRGRRRAEDAYVDALLSEREDELRDLVDPAAQFRAISAQRVLAIMRDHPRRVPGLGVPAAGIGVITAEVNVHVSVAEETVPWQQVQDILLRKGISSLLEMIRRQESRSVPAPLL